MFLKIDRAMTKVAPGLTAYFCAGSYAGFGIRVSRYTLRVVLGWFVVSITTYDFEAHAGVLIAEHKRYKEALAGLRWKNENLPKDPATCVLMAMYNIQTMLGREPVKQQRWAIYRDLFGLGSTSATELCREFGLDPDEEVGGEP